MLLYIQRVLNGTSLILINKLNESTANFDFIHSRCPVSGSVHVRCLTFKTDHMHVVFWDSLCRVLVGTLFRPVTIIETHLYDHKDNRKQLTST